MRQLIVLLDDVQCVARKALQVRVLGRLRFLAEFLHVFVVVRRHCAHIGAVEGVALQFRETVARRLVLGVELIRQLHAFLLRDRLQLVAGLAVVLHHARAEILDLLRMPVLLRQFAELDLGQAADRGILHELGVRLAQLLLGHGGIALRRHRLLRQRRQAHRERNRGGGRQQETMNRHNALSRCGSKGICTGNGDLPPKFR